jgi:hypothetical protein
VCSVDEPPAGSLGGAPLPIPDLRQILAVLVDVELVFDKLVPNHLLEVGPLATEMGQPIDDVLHQVKAIQIVLHPHIEDGRVRTFFLINTYMNVAICPTIGQSVHQRRIRARLRLYESSGASFAIGRCAASVNLTAIVRRLEAWPQRTVVCRDLGSLRNYLGRSCVGVAGTVRPRFGVTPP